MCLQWNSSLRNCHVLSYNIALHAKLKLCVEAWDEDYGSADDLIGLGDVDVSHMLVHGAPNSRLLCALHDEACTEPRGVIVLTVSADTTTLP